MDKSYFFFLFYNFSNQTNMRNLAAAAAGAKEDQIAFLEVFFLYAGPYLALLVRTAGKFYVYRIKRLAK